MIEGVNWGVFTREEEEAIKKIIALNSRENITGGVLNMTPEKEAELQKIVDQMRPLTNTFQSKVLRDFDIEKVSQGLPTGPQNPAEEAELQAKLDAELAEFQAKQAHKSLEQRAQLNKVIGRFCDHCDSKGVRHKRECPTLLNASAEAMA